jgi:hypothetical protein
MAPVVSTVIYPVKDLAKATTLFSAALGVARSTTSTSASASFSTPAPRPSSRSPTSAAASWSPPSGTPTATPSASSSPRDHGSRSLVAAGRGQASMIRCSIIWRNRNAARSRCGSQADTGLDVAAEGQELAAAFARLDVPMDPVAAEVVRREHVAHPWRRSRCHPSARTGAGCGTFFASSAGSGTASRSSGVEGIPAPCGAACAALVAGVLDHPLSGQNPPARGSPPGRPLLRAAACSR